MTAPMYLISRNADPIFALFIGLGAAATRINREEKESKRSGKETLDSLCRRVGFPRTDDPRAQAQAQTKALAKN